MVPDTRYTKSGDVHIAYQVVGDGSRDLVYLPGIFAHIELQWEEPSYARFLRRLSSFSRLIALHMRGTGLSDRSAQLPLLEHQMDDVTSVLDAVGSDRAVLFGVSQSGPMAALYAATNPQRTQALILYGAYASSAARPGGSSIWLPLNVTVFVFASADAALPMATPSGRSEAASLAAASCSRMVAMSKPMMSAADCRSR